jgi:hypothetical protein
MQYLSLTVFVQNTPPTTDQFHVMQFIGMLLLGTFDCSFFFFYLKIKASTVNFINH